MITTDRDVFVGSHMTQENKDALQAEAKRRKKSVSECVADVIEEWLITAPQEQLEEERSNRRKTDQEVDPLKDVPLPLEG